MRPYLKTSGSGPIRSREMVEISGLDQDLRWKRQGGEIAPRREEEEEEEETDRLGGLGDKEGTFGKR